MMPNDKSQLPRLPRKPNLRESLRQHFVILGVKPEDMEARLDEAMNDLERDFTSPFPGDDS